MRKNTLPKRYWTLAAQFLRLAHESCVEIVNSGNKFMVSAAKPISQFEFDQAVRWSDHAVGTGVLFSYYHGIELILKGFLAAVGVRSQHHRLTDLLKNFESRFPGTDLGKAISSALPQAGGDSPMGRFLASNSIQIDDWYEALKYPESMRGATFDHFDLKFGGQSTIPFWSSVHASSAEINSKAVTLSQHHGYA
ncbi:MAG TPA: hypothetical protein VGE57_09960 [Solimonas sp.]